MLKGSNSAPPEGFFKGYNIGSANTSDELEGKNIILLF
jgi:hypothetical protein